MPAAVRLLLLLPLLAGLTAGLRAQSLWTGSGRNNEHGLCADRKAALAGDILTIVVAENAVAQSSQQRKDSRSSSLQDTVNRFLFSTAASKLGTHGGELPAVDIAGKSDFTGGGEVNNTQSLSARAAVLVADVLSNGNLVIEGARLVTFADETQYVVLHGIVRPDDITPDNTVLSANIADARVEFFSEGSLTDAQKRGWLSKLYEKLRPF
ncbi:MAG: flagellar basal body L-ring protein FlgH [Opitutaceae bacterium]|nr:flagellar basal body L-ring protein FlgH [Opitutaceae bacterium]